MRSSLITVLIAIFLVADQATKAIINTEPWTMHYRGRAWQLEATLALLPMGALLLYSPLRFAASLIFAGVAGNLLTAILNDNYVANPFVIHNGTHSVSFNLADVILILGVVFFVVRLPTLGHDVYQWRLRRGLVWQ